MKDKNDSAPKLTPEIIQIIEAALSRSKELKIKRDKNGMITVLDITAKRIV